MLSTEEKTRRIYYLWNKAYKRAKGGVLMINKYKDLRDKIGYFGEMGEQEKIN